ncbi:hypothetical protein C1646_803318 [Rhizophagus diaphanus]|nr:hypothetical protein C1646_803318 [Rhizophagus diaphanus] [Rhizophagus sp. MUCL 43196]
MIRFDLSWFALPSRLFSVFLTFKMKSITSACTVKALKDGGPSSRFSFRKRAKINYAEPSCSPNEETDSDYEKDEEQKRTKRVRFHEEKPKEKSSSGIRVSISFIFVHKFLLGNTLPNGTKIAKLTPLDLTPSDESEDDESSLTSKKKLTAIEKAVMRYGALRIIDLSTHMRAPHCGRVEQRSQDMSQMGESFCPQANPQVTRK